MDNRNPSGSAVASGGCDGAGDGGRRANINRYNDTEAVIQILRERSGEKGKIEANAGIFDPYPTTGLDRVPDYVTGLLTEKVSVGLR